MALLLVPIIVFRIHLAVTHRGVYIVHDVWTLKHAMH